MLQEFDISITAVGDDRYLVRTEQVAPGVPLAQEQFHWPIDDWLAEASTLMYDPLLGILKGESSQRWASRPTYRSGRNNDGGPDDKLPTLVGLGQSLYNSLFDRTLRDSWLTAQGIAQHRRSPLRLRLGLKGEKLQKLPWEVLHASDRPLGTGTDVTFSRYHLQRRQGYDRPGSTVPDFDQPLRVLMVIAAPNDQDRLELAREAKHLKDELHPVSMRSGGDYNLLPQQQLDVQLTVLEQPGRAELTQALEQGHYQALHYAGHSNLGNAGGDLYLVSRQTGLTERISGEDLAGLLSNNGVKLAVLNSCRGAYAQTGGPEVGWHEQNLAHALVNRGIPGVIAMAERIPDDVAITFTQLLYRNLKQGNPIDLCLNRTRQGLISAHGSHYSYWALPILYMQPGFDGYLASKLGNDNSALDKLLMESEAAIAALDEPQDRSQTKPEEAISPADVNLDDVVETVGLDEILPNNEEDAATVQELVKKLSQSSPAGEMMPADVDEPLIPDTLETPGLDLYEQLPKKNVTSPVSETDATEATIYDDDMELVSGVEGGQTSSAQPKVRRQHIALGLGAAAVLGLAGVGVSDPLNVFNAPPVTPDDSAPVTSLELGNAGLASDDPAIVAASLGAMAAEQGPQPTLDKLIESGVGEDLTRVFAQGQLQWEVMNQSSFIDDAFGPDNAMRSWEYALELKPKWLAAQVAVGVTYYEQQRLQDAIDVWEAALANNGNGQEIPIPPLHRTGQIVKIPNEPTKLHANIGLAMAYYQQAEQELDDTEKDVKLALAKNYWEDAVKAASNREITVETVVTSHWLWSEKASIDWSDANNAIANYVSQAN
ncbi:CHAT domain-containing protein [Leptothoe kymatousa]|uniref:CHAT domain-containing protein n=1 Tax=Leptothoe kymatousa TAU-MAC 1615 TaxID=2364775 RepID=A0ABS5XYZ5_9CYAN|nr:CHAT domain-containing protein [Leptothoe kymatousa]MBT9310842.1 CHAT domain-containing protein [Leptothoe kymatousa TAU-MAC 1615]